MAGDWIKVDIDTAHKPEVLKLARLLGVHKAHAFGLVVTFWGWADKHTANGDITGVTEEDVDIFLLQPGFAKALQEVGWLHYDVTTQKMVVPSFEIHNSESAKRRAQATRRQYKWREGAKHEEQNTSTSTKEKTPRGKRSLPQDWHPSAELLATLGTEYQWRNGDAEKYVAAFKDACAAKGYQYANFDAAFRNCVRADWPKLRVGKPQPKTAGYVPI